jgi:hypothetical protein
MSFVERIIDGAMALAVRLAPRDRQELVTAMRHEMAVLDGGRVIWALGCLWATARWRTVDAAPLGLALAAVALVSDPLRSLLAMLLARHLPGDAIYVFWLALPTAICVSLAVWRPGYAVFGAAAFWLTQHAGELALVATERGWEILDAPPVVGWSAQLAWCLLGAWLGRAWAMRRSRRAAV